MEMLIHLDILELSLRGMKELIDRHPLLKPFERFIFDIFKREGIYNILFFPLKIHGKPEAILSFDWCSQETKVWSESDIHLGLEAVKIIGSNIHKKRILDELDINEQRLRLAIDTTRQGFWDWNFDTGVFYFSPSCYRILGYKENEIKYNRKMLSKMLYPGEVTEVLSRLNEFIDGNSGNDELMSEQRLRQKTGKWIWIFTRLRIVVKNDEGKPVRIVGMGFDITERKETELLVRQSEEYYSNLLFRLPHSIQQHGPDRQIVFTNPPNTDSGYEDVEMIGAERPDFFSRNIRGVIAAENERVNSERPNPPLALNLVTRTGHHPSKSNGILNDRDGKLIVLSMSIRT
jgi:PAS domain S-box-containing protein